MQMKESSFLKLELTMKCIINFKPINVKNRIKTYYHCENQDCNCLVIKHRRGHRKRHYGFKSHLKHCFCSLSCERNRMECKIPCDWNTYCNPGYNSNQS